MAAEIRARAQLLRAMKKLLLLATVWSIACGSGAKSPTTPSADPLELPAGAPRDAAAPAETSRITITTIEILGPDGARVAPDTLKVTPQSAIYKMRVWIFCPPGLEGPQGSGWNAETLEYRIRMSDVATNSGGTSGGGFRLPNGYTVIDNPLSMLRPGQQRVTTEILRNFAVIARHEFIATFSE
jgi:hypothetical protein